MPYRRCAIPLVHDTAKKEGRHKAGLPGGVNKPYVVERGLTAMTVAGTGLLLGAASVQPGSEPGVHAGRLG